MGDILITHMKLGRNLTPHTAEGMITKPGYLYRLDDFIPMIEPAFGNMLYMYPESKRHLIEVVCYPGAGHLFEPPYTSHCRHCYNLPFGSDLLWRGRLKEHAVAQEQSWQKMIYFLRTHLP